jgi:hypothetical protein
MHAANKMYEVMCVLKLDSFVQWMKFMTWRNEMSKARTAVNPEAQVTKLSKRGSHGDASRAVSD